LGVERAGVERADLHTSNIYHLLNVTAESVKKLSMALVTTFTELNTLLEAVKSPGNSGAFSLLQRKDGASTLPGQPRISLKPTELEEYLRAAHLTPELDKAVSKLWLVSILENMKSNAPLTLLLRRFLPLIQATFLQYTTNPLEAAKSSPSKTPSYTCYGTTIVYS
jgi:hypothetical protein